MASADRADGRHAEASDEAQVEQFRDEGCVFPIRIMSGSEAEALREGAAAHGAEKR